LNILSLRDTPLGRNTPSAFGVHPSGRGEETPCPPSASTPLGEGKEHPVCLQQTPLWKRGRNTLSAFSRHPSGRGEGTPRPPSAKSIIKEENGLTISFNVET